MNLQYFDNLIIPIIVAGCFCIGYVIKKWLPTDDKWIPTVVCIVGGILGFIITEKSTSISIITGVVAGAVSGLASTGVHQMIKQHLKLPMGDDEYYAMGAYQTIADTDEAIEELEEDIFDEEVYEEVEDYESE